VKNQWTATSEKGGKKYAYAPRLPQYNQINDFLMQGRSRLFQYYKNDIYKYKDQLDITADEIRMGINSANEQKRAYNAETDEHLYALLNDDINIKNNIVVIQGCSTPWYACIALAYGAKGVVIVTDRDVVCSDERVVIAKPEQVKEGFADYAMSICELQSLGLGRYGDMTEPDADVAMMGVIRKTLKPNGRLFLSIPCGADMIVFNLNRIYGRHRLKKLMEGWTLRGSLGWDAKLSKRWTTDAKYKPLFILEKQ